MSSREYELELVEENAVAEIQGMVLRLLDAKCISRTELASRMDVSVAHISQILGLEPQNLSVKKAARLFHALGEELTFSCPTIERLNREAYEHKRQREELARLTHRFDIDVPDVWCGNDWHSTTNGNDIEDSEDHLCTNVADNCTSVAA